MKRSLTGAERAALYEQANGLCEICGDTLTEGWHADHIVPFVETKTTDVTEMQATCPRCNRRKGAKVYSPRLHQAELERLANDIASGRVPNKAIVASVAPGGGKGTYPVILAGVLIPRLVEKVIAIVPRSALRDQAAKKFSDRRLREWFKAEHEINETSSLVDKLDPSRGTSGFVTTYDAIRQPGAAAALRSFMSRRKCAVFLDELHHAAVGSATESAVQALAELSAFTLIGSGTLERGDKKPIALLPYLGQGKDIRVDGTSDDYHWINYSIDDALKDECIIQTEFQHIQGRAEWIDRTGKHRVVESLVDDQDSVFAAIHTEFGDSLLRETLADFRRHQTNKPMAKLLVVCANIAAARRTIDTLRSEGLEKCDIAVSKDTPGDTGAEEAIKRFKQDNDRGGLQILVTVAMAYEGLDVPQVTHIACLTHIRSAPWILQMVARAWRVDPNGGSYHSQRAVVFVPDDALMQQVLEDIKGAMDRAKLSRESDRPARDSSEDLEPLGNILPLKSAATERRYSNWDGEDMSPEEYAAASQMMDRFGISHLSAIEFRRMCGEWTGLKKVGNVPPDDSSSTPRERLEALQQGIERHVRAAAKQRAIEPKEVNTKIVRRFNKQRGQMNEIELKEVWSWVQREFPLRSAV